MFETVKNYVKKNEMFTSEDRIIVGVSGGADSICLVLMLLELQKELGFEMIAVHVNHGLRGESAKADEQYVKEFCKKHRILLEIYSMDVESIAKKRKQSTEEAGRDVRRECFMKTLEKYRGTKIALAHHKNDNVETVLFRLVRGTGLKGLGGIEPVKGLFVRPLLCLERREIENFLNENNIFYCTDETNATDIYARNLIRNQIIPRMEEGINLRAVEHMNRMSEYLRKVQEYLEEQVISYEKDCLCDMHNGILIKEDKFIRIPEILQPLLVKNALVRISRCEKDLEEVHVNQIIDLFNKQTGRKIDLPYEVSAKRVYEGVKIFGKHQEIKTNNHEIYTPLDKPKECFRWGEWNVAYETLAKEENINMSFEKTHTKLFDCDIIKNGIHFRTRRVGDYITIHPDGRTQKLKTYFINEKIPEEERDNILLVAEGNHILWIVGYRTSCAYYVTKETKRVLKICADKGEKDGRDS